MDAKEIEQRFLEGVQNARGLRRRVVLFVAEHPNTTAAYLIASGLYIAYRIAAALLSALFSTVF